MKMRSYPAMDQYLRSLITEGRQENMPHGTVENNKNEEFYLYSAKGSYKAAMCDDGASGIPIMTTTNTFVDFSFSVRIPAKSTTQQDEKTPKNVYKKRFSENLLSFIHSDKYFKKDGDQLIIQHISNALPNALFETSPGSEHCCYAHLYRPGWNKSPNPLIDLHVWEERVFLHQVHINSIPSNTNSTLAFPSTGDWHDPSFIVREMAKKMMEEENAEKDEEKNETRSMISFDYTPFVHDCEYKLNSPHTKIIDCTLCYFVGKVRTSMTCRLSSTPQMYIVQEPDKIYTEGRRMCSEIEMYTDYLAKECEKVEDEILQETEKLKPSVGTWSKQLKKVSTV
jgi:hypothetical protein